MRLCKTIFENTPFFTISGDSQIFVCTLDVTYRLNTPTKGHTKVDKLKKIIVLSEGYLEVNVFYFIAVCGGKHHLFIC